MSTGWRAARRSRRPHTRRRMKERPKSGRASRKRRQSVRDSERALRMKGLLP